MTDQIVQTCAACGTGFKLRELIEDPTIEPIGMLVPQDDRGPGIYYFIHQRKDCESIFTVPVADFLQFIKEPVPTANLSKTDKCARHCVTIHDYNECGNECQHAPFRRFMLNDLQTNRRADAM